MRSARSWGSAVIFIICDKRRSFPQRTPSLVLLSLLLVRHLSAIDQATHTTMKNPLRAISQAFILTVGITPPTPAKERGALIFVSTLLVGMVVLAVAVFFLLIRHL